MNDIIPSSTPVFLLFGARYIELDGVTFCKVLNYPWRKSLLRMKYIKNHPQVRDCGMIGNPIKPNPPFKE